MGSLQFVKTTCEDAVCRSVGGRSSCSFDCSEEMYMDLVARDGYTLLSYSFHVHVFAI